LVISFEGLCILVRFGLTTNQAKIYLTMVQSKADTIKAISKLSNIPLESIYRAMPGLEEKNIVEKILTVPTKYKFMPISEAIALLKTRDEQERRELYEEVEALNGVFSTKKPPNTALCEEDSETSLIQGFHAYVKKVDQALENAKYSFKGITYSKAFRNGMFNGNKYFEGLVRRGIKCRHLVYQSEEVKLIELGDNHLLNNSLWVRKFISPIPIEMIIVDQKQLVIALTPQEMGKDYRGLCTTNPCLLAFADDYFELLWRNTKGNRPLSCSPTKAVEAT
jgi:sugar-specific transcriptional regulator TrmB